MSFHQLSPSANRVLVALAMFTFASWSLAAAALLAWAPGQRVALRTAARVVERLSPRRHHAPRAVPAMPVLSLASANGYGYSYSDDPSAGDFAWGLLDQDGDVWIEGGDSRRVRAQGRKGEPYFWFREGREEYVVRDPATVAEVREATEPLRVLGRRMGEVGGEMGRQGAAMGKLGGRMGAVGARLGMLETRLAMRAASRSERSEAEATLRELRAELDRMQRGISAEQAKHAGEQRELSRRMSELSARHQEALRDARIRVREIARRAVREGKAGRPHANA